MVLFDKNIIGFDLDWMDFQRGLVCQNSQHGLVWQDSQHGLVWQDSQHGLVWQDSQHGLMLSGGEDMQVKCVISPWFDNTKISPLTGIKRSRR